MDKSYISIKDLSKKFNENKIINNLSIEIDKGDLKPYKYQFYNWLFGSCMYNYTIKYK